MALRQHHTGHNARPQRQRNDQIGQRETLECKGGRRKEEGNRKARDAEQHDWPTTRHDERNARERAQRQQQDAQSQDVHWLDL